MSQGLERYRADFPMLDKTMRGHPLIYFDTAATAQKPKAVIDTVDAFYRTHYGTVHRAIYELVVESTTAYSQAREQVQKLLNAAQAHEIIFTRGTTESINLVAYSFGKAFVQPGDEILVSEMEHHSNIVPWQILCEDRRAILKVIPITDRGELRLDQLDTLLSERTKLVAVTQVSNVLGTVNPVAEVVKAAHRAGAKVLVDAAQSAPHMPIDVQALDVDFLVFSGHKFYGPTGVGILYGKEALLEAMPPYQGGGDMIETVTFPKTTYNTLPFKFEAGTPMIAEVIGLGAAISYIQQIGLSKIQQWERELLIYATQKLSQIPRLKIIGTAPEKGAIISFSIEGAHPLDLGTLLDLRGVAIRTGHHCAQPTMDRFGVTTTARASFGLYNTKEEIDHFVTAVQESIHLL